MKRIEKAGVTLTEVMIGVLIMVPLLVMLLGVFLRSVRGTVETWDETKAVASAQRMMDQIRAARWDEATPPAGGFIPAGSATLGPESTQAFNDVDDWNGFSGADPLPGHGQFTRTVTVQYVNISGAGNVTVVSSTSSYKQVTVRVTRRNGGPVTITRIIANANP
jgi:Tfp pilus assembly protein PilV